MAVPATRHKGRRRRPGREGWAARAAAHGAKIFRVRPGFRWAARRVAGRSGDPRGLEARQLFDIGRARPAARGGLGIRRLGRSGLGPGYPAAILLELLVTLAVAV